MIKNFDCKETEKLFNRNTNTNFPPPVQKGAMRKLLVLDAAISLNDLRVPPSNRLEKMQGKRKKEHSIRINKKWRISFVWRQGSAYKVKISDYH